MSALSYHSVRQVEEIIITLQEINKKTQLKNK
jgi:hypothetical protein